MFGGGQKRLLPPIKNPLFNPNEDTDNEVRISTVKSASEKNRGGRFSNLFSSRQRSSSSSSSYGVTKDEERPTFTAISRPSTSDPTTPSGSKIMIKKDLPRLSAENDREERQPGAGKARSLLSSRTKFSRNLTPSNVNNGEELSEDVNLEKPVVNVAEGRHSTLLKRGQERPPTLNREDGDHGRSLQVIDKTKLRPSFASDSEQTRTKFVESCSAMSAGSEEKKVKKPKYQDALSLRNDWRAAKASGDYKSIQTFLTCTFDSFNDINAVFKKREECLGDEDQDGSFLDHDFVRITYDIVLTLPQEVQKAVLKSIINGLLQDMKRQRTTDDLRAFTVLLQNPQFNKSTTYVIFAHLLRQVSCLSDSEHQCLVRWFRKIPINIFKGIITRIQQFLSLRLFPTKSTDLPPEEKCTWWVPSAVKVLALLNAANWLQLPPLMSHTYYYNHSLDHIDLMGEYYSWQNPGNNAGKFSFCQYPFILSLGAKRYVMQKDSESQMIVMARKSLMEKVQRREMPDMGMLFLNIKVRRLNLISDSLNEIARKQKDLKKKLKVTFAGEPGLDMGGLTKEWFLLLIRKIFKPEYGMFTYNEKSRLYWFNQECKDQDEEFNLVGVLMGLAVYNSIILDIKFPSSVYKKLLSPAVVPFHNPNATVGVANLELDDLTEAMPDLARGLKELLRYEGDVENDLCQTFQVSHTSFGQVITHNLKPKGDTIPVTNHNKQEYVNLYVDYLLNKSMYQQFAAFYHGFHSVCASNALIMLRPEEVEMLVCGNPELDMEALKKVTMYDGYSKSDGPIRYFWEIVLAFSTDLKKKTLLFVTGSDRIPIGGMAEMEFKICKMEALDSTRMLPMAHTCFNQLILPPYKNRKQLKQKLTIAISNAEGFGIE